MMCRASMPIAAASAPARPAMSMSTPHGWKNRPPDPGSQEASMLSFAAAAAAQLTSLLPDCDARRARWAHRADAGGPALADWSTNNGQNWSNTMDTHVNYDLRADAVFDAARQIRRQRPEALPGRHLVPLFRAAAPRSSGALVPDSPFGPYWSVSKYKDIMQVEVNHAGLSSDELGGIQIEDQPKDHGAPQLHPHGPAAARRAAQGGQPDRRPGQPREHGGADPRADPQACSTRCRATRISTGSTGSRSS